jgi:heme exporter protein C
VKLHTATGILLLAAFAAIFFYAPQDAQQGIVQKIFYLHVACAITMYMGFALSFLASLLYLVERKWLWDELGVASAEAGFFLCTCVLLTGPLWGKPVWGAWWTWDPRLTSTLLLEFLYAGYLVLRTYFGPSDHGRKVAAVVAVIAFLDVPLVHYAVRLWRGMHPSVLGPRGGGLSPSMKITFFVTLVAVTFLFLSLLRARFRLEQARNRLTRLQLERSENL